MLEKFYFDGNKVEMRRCPLETSIVLRDCWVTVKTVISRASSCMRFNSRERYPKGARFTSPSGRLTRLSRRDVSGARACKDSISVSTGGYSKDTGTSATGRTRSSGVPADPSVARTRSYSSDTETSECSRLPSRQT